MKKIRAWLDDYKLIRVYPISNIESQVFSMRLNNQVIILEPHDIGNHTCELYLPKSLKLENTYYLNINNEPVLIEYRFVTKTEKFNKFFYYSGKLGSVYEKKATSFYLWAPTASQVDVVVNGTRYSMNRTERGVYFVRVNGDLEKAEYLYQLEVNGEWVEVIDPYSDAVSPNGKKSVVINTEKLRKMKEFHQKESPVIYECSVRDFTSDPDTDIVHKGKYIGMTEKGRKDKNGNACGLDYLKEIGITHVQIMPVNLIGSVDELHPEKTYNWGYDPVLYTTVSGAYCTDANDPYCRIEELQQMAEELHESNIGVIYDVVFNHIYHAHNVFEKIVPYYYFRYDEKMKLYNGSGCGNDLDTKMPMVQHYIRAGAEMFIRRFAADGLRFDLMGLIDNTTMLDLQDYCRSLKEDILLYGEGWNMITGLKDEEKTSIQNMEANGKLAYFNDWFRNTLRGYGMQDKGYLNGECSIGKAAINAFVGCTFKYLPGHLFDEPEKSINYLECHDNATIYDRLKNYSEADRISIAKSMLAAIMLSQGIPFIHSGQEFLRTKKGVDNSYNSGDEINRIDYSRKDRYKQVVEYFKDLVKLRKKLGIFDFSYRQIVERYSFKLIYDTTLKISVNTFGISQEYTSIKILINPHEYGWNEELDQEYQLLLDEKGERDEMVDHIHIKPFSIYVCAARI